MEPHTNSSYTHLQQQYAPQPGAAPPAAAPPPPPPSESDAGSVRSVNLNDGDENQPTTATQPLAPNESSTGSTYYGSYQTNRTAPVPMITNYGMASNSEANTDGLTSEASAMPMMRGDPLLRPNTGQTNDEFGGVGSLREVTSRLRWMTVACTLTAMIWEGFAFPTRLIIHVWDQPAKVVLGAFLAFFCFLLLGVELNAPMRDNFGVLYHPLGRAFLLLLMSSMCVGILFVWWEFVMALAFGCCAAGYTYAYVKYPEYRRWQDYNDNKIWQDVQQAVNQRSGGVGWADPSANITSFGKGLNQGQQETQSLLQ